MNAKKLQAFCQRDVSTLCAPFSFGGFTYATDARILVRVPRLKEVPEGKALNGIVADLFDNVDFNKIIPALVAIPDFHQPEPCVCGRCNGTGALSLCPECNGKGEVVLENQSRKYTCKCLSCDGAGYIVGRRIICPDCNGGGRVRVVATIAVGKVFFGSQYLTLLKELPGIKIAPLQKSDANYFCWEGGEGLLMPIGKARRGPNLRKGSADVSSRR